MRYSRWRSTRDWSIHRGGSRSAAREFLEEAANALTDWAHLDLIGEYLWSYAYPSPDPRFPGMIGTKQFNGDVQQTVWQSCSTSLGGRMHGDCVDIAEVYQAILELQHRNPVIIGLPLHRCVHLGGPGAGEMAGFCCCRPGNRSSSEDTSLPLALKRGRSMHSTLEASSMRTPCRSFLRFDSEVAHFQLPAELADLQRADVFPSSLPRCNATCTTRPTRWVSPPCARSSRVVIPMRRTTSNCAGSIPRPGSSRPQLMPVPRRTPRPRMSSAAPAGNGKVRAPAAPGRKQGQGDPGHG